MVEKSERGNVGLTHLVPCPEHLRGEPVPSAPEASHVRDWVSRSDRALVPAVRHEKET